MNTNEVRTVSLPPLRVAAALGFGPSPEGLAWQTLLDWVHSQGVLNAQPAPRFFGFNNPNPSPGSPNYGYEQWVTVGPAVQGTDQVTLKEMPGATYVVTRCQLRNITPAWQALVAWAEDNGRPLAPGQCLEECLGDPAAGIDEDTEFDLYLPVAAA